MSKPSFVQSNLNGASLSTSSHLNMRKSSRDPRSSFRTSRPHFPSQDGPETRFSPRSTHPKSSRSTVAPSSGLQDWFSPNTVERIEQAGSALNRGYQAVHDTLQNLPSRVQSSFFQEREDKSEERPNSRIRSSDSNYSLTKLHEASKILNRGWQREYDRVAIQESTILATETRSIAQLNLSDLSLSNSEEERREVVLSMRQTNVLHSPRVYDSVIVNQEENATREPSNWPKTREFENVKCGRSRVQQVTMGPFESDSICDVFYTPQRLEQNEILERGEKKRSSLKNQKTGRHGTQTFLRASKPNPDKISNVKSSKLDRDKISNVKSRPERSFSQPGVNISPQNYHSTAEHPLSGSIKVGNARQKHEDSADISLRQQVPRGQKYRRGRNKNSTSSKSEAVRSLPPHIVFEAEMDKIHSQRMAQHVPDFSPELFRQNERSLGKENKKIKVRQFKNQTQSGKTNRGIIITPSAGRFVYSRENHDDDIEENMYDGSCSHSEGKDLSIETYDNCDFGEDNVTEDILTADMEHSINQRFLAELEAGRHNHKDNGAMDTLACDVSFGQFEQGLLHERGSGFHGLPASGQFFGSGEFNVENESLSSESLHISELDSTKEGFEHTVDQRDKRVLFYDDEKTSDDRHFPTAVKPNQIEHKNIHMDKYNFPLSQDEKQNHESLLLTPLEKYPSSPPKSRASSLQNSRKKKWQKEQETSISSSPRKQVHFKDPISESTTVPEYISPVISLEDLGLATDEKSDTLGENCLPKAPVVTPKSIRKDASTSVSNQFKSNIPSKPEILQDGIEEKEKPKTLLQNKQIPNVPGPLTTSVLLKNSSNYPTSSRRHLQHKNQTLADARSGEPHIPHNNISDVTIRTNSNLNIGPDFTSLQDMRLQRVVQQSPPKEKDNIILKARYFRRWRRNVRLLKIVNNKRKLKWMKSCSFHTLTLMTKHFLAWNGYVKKCRLMAEELHRHHVLRKGFAALSWAVHAKRMKRELIMTSKRKLKLRKCFYSWKKKYQKCRLETLCSTFSRWKTRCRNKVIVDMFSTRRERLVVLQSFFFWKENFHDSQNLRIATNHYTVVLLRKFWHIWRIYTAESIVQKAQKEVAEIKHESWTLARFLATWRKSTIQMQFAKMHFSKKICSCILKTWKHSTSISRVHHQKEMTVACEIRRVHLIRLHFKEWRLEVKVHEFRKKINDKNKRNCMLIWKSQLQRHQIICAEVASHHHHVMMKHTLQALLENVYERKEMRMIATQKLEKFCLRRSLTSWHQFTMRKVRLRNMQKTFYWSRLKANMHALFQIWRQKLQLILQAQEKHHQWTLTCVRKAADKWMTLLNRKKQERLCLEVVREKKKKKLKDHFNLWKQRIENENRSKQRGESYRVILLRERIRRIVRAWNLYTMETIIVRPLVERIRRKRIAKYFDAWTSLVTRRAMQETMSQQICQNRLRECFALWKRKFVSRNNMMFAEKQHKKLIQRRAYQAWRKYTSRCQSYSTVSKRYEHSLVLRAFYTWATKTTFRQIVESKRLQQDFIRRANVHQLLLRWRSATKIKRKNKEDAIVWFRQTHGLAVKRSNFDRWKNALSHQQVAANFASDKTKQRVKVILQRWRNYTNENMKKRTEKFSSSIQSLRKQSSRKGTPTKKDTKATQSDNDVIMSSRNSNCDVITQTSFPCDVIDLTRRLADELAANGTHSSSISSTNSIPSVNTDVKVPQKALNTKFRTQKYTGTNSEASTFSSLSTRDNELDSEQGSVVMTTVDSGVILLRDYVSTETSTPERNDSSSVSSTESETEESTFRENRRNSDSETNGVLKPGAVGSNLVPFTEEQVDDITPTFQQNQEIVSVNGIFSTDGHGTFGTTKTKTNILIPQRLPVGKQSSAKHGSNNGLGNGIFVNQTIRVTGGTPESDATKPHDASTKPHDMRSHGTNSEGSPETHEKESFPLRKGEKMSSHKPPDIRYQFSSRTTPEKSHITSTNTHKEDVLTTTQKQQKEASQSYATTLQEAMPLPCDDPYMQPILCEFSHMSSLPVDNIHVPPHIAEEQATQTSLPISKDFPHKNHTKETHGHVNKELRDIRSQYEPGYLFQKENVSNEVKKLPEPEENKELSANSQNEYSSHEKFPHKDHISDLNGDVEIPHENHTASSLQDRGVQGASTPINRKSNKSTNYVNSCPQKSRIPVPHKKCKNHIKQAISDEFETIPKQIFGHEMRQRSPNIVTGLGDNKQIPHISACKTFRDESVQNSGSESDYLCENDAKINAFESISSSEKSESTDLLSSEFSSTDDDIGSLTSSSSVISSIDDGDVIIQHDDDIESATKDILSKKPRPTLPIHPELRDPAIPVIEWLVRLAVIRMRYRPLAFTFYQWKLLIHAKKWEKEMMSHMKERHCALTMQHYFRTWQAKKFQLILAKNHWNRSVVQKCFNNWNSWVEKQKMVNRMKSDSEKVQKWNLLKSIFKDWKQKTQHRTALLEILKYWQGRVVDRNMPSQRDVRKQQKNDSALLYNCFSTWKLKTEQVKLADKHYKVTLIQRHLGKWHNWASERATVAQKCQKLNDFHLKRRVFRAWRARVELMHKVKVMQRKSLRKWAASIIERWFFHTQVVSRHQSIMSLITAENTRKTLQTCLQAWKNKFTKRKLADVMYRRNLVRRSIQAWRDVTMENFENKQKTQTVQNSVSLHTKRRVFKIWRDETTQQLKVGLKKEEKLEFLLKKCWNNWKEAQDMRKAASAHVLIQKRIVFKAWKRYTLQRKAENEKARSAIVKWHEITVKNRNLSQKADQFHSNARMLAMEITFNTWVVAFDQTIKAQRHHKDVVSRKAFVSWKNWTQHKNLLRKMQKNFVNQKTRELFAISWYKWKFHYGVKVNCTRVILDHQREVSHRLLGKYWLLWKQKKQEKDACKVCVGMSVRRTFKTWKERLENIQRADQLVKDHETRRLRGIVTSWHSHVANKRKERHLVSKLRDSRNNIQTLQFFMTWLRRYRDSKIATAFRNKNLQMKAIICLRIWSMESRRLNDCYAKAVQCVHVLKLKFYFSQWKNVYREVRMLEVTCDHLRTVKSKENLKKCFKTWFKAKEKRDLRRMHERNLAQDAIKKWRRYAVNRIQKQRIREERSDMVERFQNYWACRKAFVNWKQEYQICRFMAKRRNNLRRSCWNNWSLRTAVVFYAREMDKLWTLRKHWYWWRLEHVTRQSTNQAQEQVNRDLMKAAFKMWRAFAYRKKTGQKLYCKEVNSPVQELSLTPRKQSRIPRLKK